MGNFVLAARCKKENLFCARNMVLILNYKNSVCSFKNHYHSKVSFRQLKKNKKNQFCYQKTSLNSNLKLLNLPEKASEREVNSFNKTIRILLKILFQNDEGLVEDFLCDLCHYF